ncbi:serine hydrolase [Paenibacillus favisporus]|uniref:serine hydrolase domain-containing protein n=1 Tax=Paenibacillus favisporus TaxID=221028 RepID=UPI002DB7CA60|nr:serine hydrolase domain-containing protein [Paenibacillus favisporus]MEC0174559.1 serine hydrolase [Paenibacillus favisporus]
MSNIQMNHNETSLKLRRYMHALASRGYFNGAILVAQHGRILLNEGYGMANFEHDVPNSPNTKFRIGSLTKAFTAMAILQLQEQGKLNVQDYIGQYLEDYPNGHLISLHHLLSHSSGIPDYPGFPGYWEQTQRLYSTLEETIQMIKDKPLEFTPGEEHRYCSSSYILLSAIIEKVSGISYGEYIKERICQPLHLENTGIEDCRTIVKDLASGYSVCKEIIHAEYVDMTLHLGAGAMYSTVEDLYVWDRALYTDTLVSKDSLKILFDQYTTYCGSYGWVVDEQKINKQPRKRIGHFGSMNGFWSDFNRYVNDDLVIIVLSNFDLTPVQRISQCLAELALGGELQELGTTNPIHINDSILKQLEGIYEYGEKTEQGQNFERNMKDALVQLVHMDIPKISIGVFYKVFQEYGINPNSTIIVTYEDSKLFLFMQKNHGAWYKYEIYPVSNQANSITCVAKDLDERVVFNIKPSGGVRISHFDVYGNDTIAYKTQ